MKETTELGLNRTGVNMHPINTSEMTKPAKSSGKVAVSHSMANELRQDYMEETGGIGTVPVPGTVKGVVKSGGQMLKGQRPEILIDKLGERLAFERTGVRLYDALILKCEQNPDTSPPLDQLRRFQKEEADHFDMVRRALETLGADPTAITPSADVDGVASMGLIQVLRDPRTTVAHALHAIHIAELADNDGWEMLISLTRGMGKDEMAEEFETAYQEEQEHLAKIRSWMRDLLEQESKATLDKQVITEH